MAPSQVYHVSRNMDGCDLKTDDFYVNSGTHVSLYKVLSRAPNPQPLVVSRYHFDQFQQEDTLERIVQTINAALSQARVQHTNACELLEVQLEVRETNCAVYHVMETLDGDLRQEIEQRRRSNRPYEEAELRQIVLQTARVLTTAHNKSIPHGDVRPCNIFKVGDKYKVGNFGCFYTSLEVAVAKSSEEDVPYMSPQFREALLGNDTQYNAFKADVFSLGISILHLATLNPPEIGMTAESLEEAIDRQIAPLPYSPLLRGMIKTMVSYEEGHRPTMKHLTTVLAHVDDSKPAAISAVPKLKRTRGTPVSALSSDTVAEEDPPATRFIGIWSDTAFLYEIQTQLYSIHTLSLDFYGGGTFIEIDRNTMLCVGGLPALSNVYSLDLSTFTLNSMLPLVIPRAGGGLAKMNAYFYVFGGFDRKKKAMRTCEKMQLPDQHWAQISSMVHPRAYFTPCRFRTLFYLVSANKEAQRTIETFSAETESFAVLPVALPPRLRLNFPSVAFVANEELCFLMEGRQMARWKIETEREFRLYDTNHPASSGQPPLIVGSTVLIACMGNLMRFSLETYSFIE